MGREGSSQDGGVRVRVCFAFACKGRLRLPDGRTLTDRNRSLTKTKPDVGASAHHSYSSDKRTFHTPFRLLLTPTADADQK